MGFITLYQFQIATTDQSCGEKEPHHPHHCHCNLKLKQCVKHSRPNLCIGGLFIKPVCYQKCVESLQDLQPTSTVNIHQFRRKSVGINLIDKNFSSAKNSQSQAFNDGSFDLYPLKSFYLYNFPSSRVYQYSRFIRQVLIPIRTDFFSSLQV